MPLNQFLRSTTMLSGVVGATFIAVMTAQAADTPVKAAPYSAPPALPAVDGINYKFDVLGGSLAEEGFGGARGSVSIPLGFRYGLQLDATGSSYEGEFLGSVSGHLFWRDPGVGLLGLYASYLHWDKFGGLHASRVALEAEHYHGPWTFSAVLGVEAGNTKSQLNGSVLETIGVKSRFYDMIDIHYYMNENTRFSIGHRYLGGKNALALGTEWSVPIAPRTQGSFFLEGRIGESDYKSIWAGLRVYMGRTDKTLIRRHREDDPENREPEGKHSFNKSKVFGGEGGDGS